MRHCFPHVHSVRLGLGSSEVRRHKKQNSKVISNQEVTYSMRDKKMGMPKLTETTYYGNTTNYPQPSN